MAQCLEGIHYFFKITAGYLQYLQSLPDNIFTVIKIQELDQVGQNEIT